MFRFYVVFLATFVSSVRAGDFEPSVCLLEKRGTCPHILIHPSNQSCTSSNDCEGARICCYGKDNISRCTDPMESKADDCPPPNKIKNANEGCTSDSDCLDREKCCRTNGCSFACAFPIRNESTIETRQNPNRCPFPGIPTGARCPTNPASWGTTECESSDDCSDSDNYRLCCPNGSGLKVCSEPYTTVFGECDSMGNYPIDPTNPAFTPCFLDSNCLNNMKCCKDSSTCFTCRYPKLAQTPQGCFSIPKRGVCPAVLINEGRTSCTTDAECPGNRICCRRSISSEKRCTDPFTLYPQSQCPSPANMKLNNGICYVDDDCPYGYKCCPFSNCSYFCSPVQVSNNVYYCETQAKYKYGACPQVLINPSRACQINNDCPGRQICCGGVCSDPSTTKTGQCPPPNQVPRGPTTCNVDENCTGSTYRKCCPDFNCNYYCTYSV